jgi:hypothetical protein
MCSDNDENSICGFICHICGNYFSKYKKNITYHITKKYKCSLQTSYSYEESVILSEKKQFHFNKNVFNKIDSYIDIVECFTEEHNYINENYLETIENIKNPPKKVEKNSNVKMKKSKSEIKDNKISCEDSCQNKEILSDHEDEDIIDNKKNKKNAKHGLKKKYSIFVNDDNKYECPSCHDIFYYPRDIQTHMFEFEECKKKTREYDIFNYYKGIGTNHIHEVSTQTSSYDYVEKSFSEICIGTDDIDFDENKKIEIVEEDIYNFYKSKQSKSDDFNSDNYEDVQEYVYMIQMAVNVAKKENIVKIGMTKNMDPYKRIDRYEHGYKILQISVVKNAAKVEKELLKYFRTKFTSCNHLSKEIFQGSIQDMIIAFKMISL